MHEGSCLCGGIRFTLDAELGTILMCHCAQCRKASGTAFAANTPVAEERFTLRAGAELIREYESSPGKVRAFCARCGSPIYSKTVKLPGVLRLRLGSFDTPLGREPDCHIFAASKADWYEIRDALPQFAESPPRRS
jgi:hypothetical protein